MTTVNAGSLKVPPHRVALCLPRRVLTYQPTVRMPNVQALDPSYLTSSLADYPVPFHPSTLASIPADMKSELVQPKSTLLDSTATKLSRFLSLSPAGLDLFSLIQADPQVKYLPSAVAEINKRAANTGLEVVTTLYH